MPMRPSTPERTRAALLLLAGAALACCSSETPSTHGDSAAGGRSSDAGGNGGANVTSGSRSAGTTDTKGTSGAPGARDESSGTSSSGTAGRSTTGAGGTSTGGAGGSSASGAGGSSVKGAGGSSASGAGGSSASGAGGSSASGAGGSSVKGAGGSSASGASGSSTGGAGGRSASGTGGSSASGASGSSTGGAGGANGDAPFVLDWQDDFNALNASLWQAQNFTWDGNQAQFTPDNVAVANGKLSLSLTKAPSSADKPYLGVELRSTKTLTYGKVSASMRFASGSGVVSGLVLFYTPYPNCDWNEIDIEHLGKSTNSSQLNCQIFAGNVVNDCTTSVSPKQDPQVADLGVNVEAAFHQYDIEWTPAGVKFYIDGTLLRTWAADIARLKLPQNILLTIWASDSASWAGPLNAASAPTSAEVDWIKIYKWTGSQ